MPVAVPVRNLSGNKVIISSPGSKDSIEWGHKGCEDGSDVQEVPEELWMGNKLRKAVANGILVEDTPEAMSAAIERQQAARERKAADRQGQVDAALAQSNSSRDIVISASDFEAHLESTAKQRGESDVLEKVTAGIPSASNQTAMDAVNSL